MGHSQGHHNPSISYHDLAVLLCDSRILRKENAWSIDSAASNFKSQGLFNIETGTYLLYMHTCEVELFLGGTLDNF